MVREKKTFLSTGMCQLEGLTVSTGILQGQAGRERPVRCTGRNRSWAHGRAQASTSIHEHPVRRCTGRNRSWVHGRARASTSIPCAAHVGVAHGPIGRARASASIHEHPVRCTGRNLSWVHVRARACTSSHEHPLRCTGMNCSLVRGRARPSTSILCAAQVGRGLQEDAREAIQLRFANSALVSVLPVRA